MTTVPTVDERTATLGKHLVNQLYVLMKTARSYDPTNSALKSPLEGVIAALKDPGMKPEVSLRLRGDYLFLDETRLKLDIEGFQSFLWLAEEIKRRGIGGILFTRSVQPETVKRFAYVFIQFDPKPPDPYAQFVQQMAAAGIVGIEVERPQELAVVEEDRRDLKQMAKETYARAIAAATDVINNAKLGRAVGFRKAKRMVQSLVELLLQEEPIVLGLTTLRCHEEYTHNHSVNVCILSLLVASRLGYSKTQLGDMGVAFLFHDIGKLNIPLAILNKPDSLTEEEWQIMRTHPIQGVKAVIKLKGVSDPSMSRLVTAAFEHHLGYDGTGYPKLAAPWQQSLIGRITAIADCYDAITSARVYIRSPFSPDKALQYMLERAGKAFDPVLLKVFINSVGIFPIGTLVLLDTKELGVVVQANPSLLDRPKVKLLTNRSGDEIDGEVVDLAGIDARTNRFRRSIVKAIDSTKYNIDTARYFI